jgi:hypothetical protein
MGTRERVGRISGMRWGGVGIFLYSCYDGMSKVLLGVDRIVFKTVIVLFFYYYLGMCVLASFFYKLNVNSSLYGRI